MALLGSVSGKDVDAFALGLAQDLAKRYPPALDKGKERKISQKRLSSILEDTYARAIEFRREHNLGVYKKARLGNTFRWELQDMGYSANFIEVAVEGLIVYITRK